MRPRRRAASSHAVRSRIIRASTSRTAASHAPSSRRPLAVSLAWRIRPWSGCARRRTSPRRSRVSSTSFIDCGEHKGATGELGIGQPAPPLEHTERGVLIDRQAVGPDDLVDAPANNTVDASDEVQQRRLAWSSSAGDACDLFVQRRPRAYVNRSSTTSNVVASSPLASGTNLRTRLGRTPKTASSWRYGLPMAAPLCCRVICSTRCRPPLIISSSSPTAPWWPPVGWRICLPAPRSSWQPRPRCPGRRAPSSAVDYIAGPDDVLTVDVSGGRVTTEVVAGVARDHQVLLTELRRSETNGLEQLFFSLTAARAAPSKEAAA